MSDWAERMTKLIREQGKVLNGPGIQMATMTGQTSLAIGNLTLTGDDLVFSAHLLDLFDVPILKAGDIVTVIQMSDSRFWVMDKVGGGLVCNGLGQTASGTILDASQGHVLDGRVTTAQETADEALSAAEHAADMAIAAAALVATKFDTANVVNNLTTTASGYALDARQGKALNDKLIAADQTYTYTAGSHVSIRNIKVYENAFMAQVDIYFDVTAALGNNAVVVTLGNALPVPIGSYAVAAVHNVTTTVGMVSLQNTDATAVRAWGQLPVGQYYYAQLIYLKA